MLGLEKSILNTLLDETIRTLDWRRAVLWREIAKLQSEYPWEAKQARSKVNRLKEELEKDFKQAHRILTHSRHLSSGHRGTGWNILAAVILFFCSLIPLAQAGVIGATFDAAGEVLALPFQVVAEGFRIIF